MFYECIVNYHDYDVCCPVFNSITKVAMFLDSVDLDCTSVVIVRSDGRIFDAKDLKEIWNA